MYLDRDGKQSGICGEKADFTDTLGNQLYVGDMVITVHTTNFKICCGTNLIVKDADTGKYEVMGLYDRARQGFTNNSEWKIYRAIPYNEIPEGYCQDSHTYKPDKKKMTVSEICKELGYEVEIIKG